MVGRGRNYHGEYRKGYRGGPRRKNRAFRYPELQSNPSPSWLAAGAIAALGLGAAYVLIARPNLPGSWDAALYAKLPVGWPVLTHRGQVDTGDVSVGGGTTGIADDPLIGDVTLTVA